MFAIAIILACIMVYVYKEWKEGYGEYVLASLNGLFSGFIVIMFWVFISFGFIKETDFKQIDVVPITSVQPKDGITGSFFLGTGIVNSQQQYFMMQIIDDNSYKPINVYTNQVMAITEDNSMNPALVIYRKTNTNRLITILFGINCEYSVEYAYKIIVPKGTVITEFKVN